MSQCEICGKNTELLACVIEGCTMSVCGNCAKFGTVTQRVNAIVKGNAKLGKSFAKQEEEEPVVVDASKKVKEAREAKGLTQGQLAKAIAEKESIIHKIESGNAEPSMETAKKLERFFGIKLIEIVKREATCLKVHPDEAMTIGDLMRKR